MPLGKKLLIIFLSLLIAPLILVSLLSYYHARENLELSIRNRLAAINKLKATRIEELIRDVSDEAGLLASPILSEILNDQTGLAESGETIIGKKITLPDGTAELIFLTPLKYGDKDGITQVFEEKPGLARPMQNALKGETGTGIASDYRGELVLASWRHFSELDWELVSKIDLVEAYVPINDLRNLMILLVLMAVTFDVVIVLLVVKSITDPLRALHHGTEKIGAGDLDYKVGIAAADEIGQLSRAFDAMVAKLKKTMASRDELDSLSRIKTDFVATVSHELRTPLAIIKEAVALVKEGLYGEVNDKQQKFLTTATSNVDRLARLIDDLLNISRIESGKLVINLAPIDICAIADKVVKLLQVPAAEKNLYLTLDQQYPGKGMVLADPDKTEQVFVNLINNSMKYTEKGGIRITLSETDAGDHIQISVVDSGIGIKETDMPKLFDKFEQFNRLTGSGAQGTGLGLAICKGLVEAMHGKIWAESTLGKGTKFYFTLPKVIPT